MLNLGIPDVPGSLVSSQSMIVYTTGGVMTGKEPDDNSAGKYSVFFSHKARDCPVAEAIIDLLDRHTENVSFFISEKIEKGTNWRKSIADHLSRSSFLVLLFTDPKEDWGWCLYETGFFDALTQARDSASVRRLYCLHNEATTPPNPISDLQTVSANVDEIEQWLRELFQHTKQNKARFMDAIPGLAVQIRDLFSNPKNELYSESCISLTLDRSAVSSPNELPDDAILSGERSLVAEVFGHGLDEVHVKKAKAKFASYPKTVEANRNTFRELARFVNGVINNEGINPLQGVIFVDDGPKRYRPVVHTAAELPGNKVRFDILLVEDAGGQLQNIDRNLGALLTAIRIAVRIRWEIIKPFVGDLDGLAKLDARKLRFDLQTCFNNIFLEAEFRGSYSSGDVLSAFETREQKTKMLAIVEQFDRIYPDIWRSLGFPNASATFGEVSDEPFADGDLALLRESVCALRQLNSDFLAIAMPRAQSLIFDEIGRGADCSTLAQIEPLSGTQRLPHTRERESRENLNSRRRNNSLRRTSA